MLITNEAGALESALQEAAANNPHPDTIEAFRLGWAAGRKYEESYHAAMAREMCGPNGRTTQQQGSSPLGHVDTD